MNDLVVYENKKLGLRKYLQKLDNMCKSKFGPLNKYVYPVDDPYKTYVDVDDFKTQELKDSSEDKYLTATKTCKFISGASSKKDKDGRYYTEVQNERECEIVDGIWDEKTLNRKNKYDVGTCWVDESDRVCSSKLESLDVFRPYRLKYKKDAVSKIVSEAERCNKDPVCKWEQQTAYTYDCVRNKDKAEDRQIVMNPPEDMPLEEFEEFLEKWYGSKKAPEVSELLGRGDRCKGVPDQDPEDILPPPPLEMPPYVEVRKLRPTVLADVVVLKKYMTDGVFKLFKEQWLKKQNMTALQYKKYIGKDKDHVESFYNYMDKLQFQSDYRIRKERAKTPAAKKMLPSLPQSIVNMVMKNVAMKKGSQRGMLAWHSTGSGKCHAKDTPILMFDGSVKMVQDIVVGDLVMGDDSTAREVLALGTGEDDMYDIIGQDGQYRVNSEHILCLKHSNKIMEIPVKEYIELPLAMQKKLKGYRVAVDFESRLVEKDPWSIGYFGSDLSAMRECIINSVEIRYNLLAGLVDRNHGFILREHSTETKNLIVFLCRSLGFGVKVREIDDHFRISVYGKNLDKIPVRLTRKAPKSYSKRDVLASKIKVQFVERGTYYGFTLDGNHRYLMGDFTVTHNTATATGVMDAFWDTEYRIIFASSIDAIASNPDFVFHQLAMKLFPRFSQNEYVGNSEAHSLALIAEAFKKRRVRYLSFAKLSNRVQKAIKYKKEFNLKGGAPREKTHDEILAGDDYVDLDKCVLIVDEVHNLFRPLPNQKKEHEALEKELLDVNKHPNMKIVILTATPGDNIPDIIKLINIVRTPGTSPITAPNVENLESIKQFKKSMRGLISFFDMSADDTKFPRVVDSAPVKLPMSDAQFARYVEAYKSIKAIQKNYSALAKKNEVGKYYEPARKYANSLFNFVTDMGLNDFSAKIPKVLENFAAFPNEKHYLYSAFASRAGYGGHGVYAIAKEMEKVGYKKLTVLEARKLNKAGKLPDKGVKRYIMATNVDLGEDGGNAGKNLHELLRIYNHPDNKDGEHVHVMLASNKYNESIDMKAIGHLHMFEPFVTMAAEKQFIGRAVRTCSHVAKDRSKGEWIVHIHRYMSDKPILVPVDKGPARQKIQDEINALEDTIATLADKEAFKIAQKKYKDKEKEIAKVQKLVEKGKPGDLKGLTKELDELGEQVEGVKKALEDAKKGVAEVKAQLAAKKKELKLLDKPSKLDKAGDVEHVEQRIYDEARERFKELFTVYQSMKEAAVDCKLLKEFHSATGVEVACETF